MRDSIVPQNMRYSQNDLNSAKILINVNHNGNEEDFSDATAVRVSFEKSDKKIVYQDCQPINALKGKYQTLLTTQSLTSVGFVTANVHIYFPNGKKVETRSFTFEVVESKMSDGVIESTNEFGVMQKWVEAAEVLKDVEIPPLIESKITAEKALAKSNELGNQFGILSGTKTDKAYVDTKVSAVASGAPKGVYATLTALQTAKPTGDSGVYLVTADGKWYYWNGSAWTPGGTYQATGIADKTIDVAKLQFLNVINLNLHNPATDTAGSYISQAGGLIANASYKVSDYIPIIPLGMYNNSSTLSCAFFDVDKKYISGLPAGFTNPYTAPANAVYVRHSYNATATGVLCEGPVLVDSSATFGSQKIVVTKAEFENMIQEIVVKTNTKTEGKSLLIFADSTGQTANIADDFSSHVDGWKTNWPTFTKEALKIGAIWNYGKDGAGYKERPGLLQTQWITNQIRDAISKNRPGDIIVVATGTNDGITDVGDFDTAMSKTKLEDLDKTKLYEAIRWCYWTLRQNYPNAMFYVGIPLQRTSYSPQVAEPMVTAIKKMANYYNFIIVDCMYESGIVREFEVQGGPGRDLSDGLHPNDSSGKKKHANLFTRVIRNTYTG
ncbi:BppU family phage baseplate upper protein [Bacillus proteolyticus]